MGEEKYWQIFHEINFSFFWFGLVKSYIPKICVRHQNWTPRSLLFRKKGNSDIETVLKPFHEGGRYHVETSPLICFVKNCSITAVFTGLTKGLCLKEHCFSLLKSLCAKLSYLKKRIIMCFSLLRFISLFWLLLR